MTRWLFTLLLILTSISPVHAVTDDELLPVEQAFALTVNAKDANTVVARWAIAEGYYLYRERFRLASLSPAIKLGEARFPPGKIKEDQFFGKMETYRDEVAVEIPLQRDPNGNAFLELETTSQGCADLGICYPPQKQTTTIELPPLAVVNGVLPSQDTDDGVLPSQNTDDGILSSQVTDITGIQNTDTGKANLLERLIQQSPAQSDNAELPPADQAFIASVTALDGDTLRVNWTIDDCCYLYKERFAFSSATEGINLGPGQYPQGLHEEDEFYGQVEIYRGSVSIDIPLSRIGDSRELDLIADFQGCADIGVCYPPQQQTIPVMLGALADAIVPPANAAPVNDSGAINGPGAGTTSEQIFIAEQDQIANLLVKQRFWALPAFFGFGLLLAFTPCVFPMVPILSSIIVGHGGNLTQRRAFLLSLVYVLAMALTYTVAGVAAAMLGQNVQVWFQNPWVLTAFAGLFVLLALSMFGFYELQMPARLQSKLTEFSNRQSGGKYAGVATMGFLSALIVGPCVAPPLIGVLTVIGSTGDATLGGAALFALSMGMGAPLLLIGTSAAKLLPRAGKWMDIVKAVFGVLLLAVAIWMLERILPEVISMLLWATLLIVSAVYMGALQSSSDMSGGRMLSKGLGVVMLVYGVLLLVGVAAGGRDTLQPLRGVMLAGSSAPEQHLTFRRIKTVADLERQIAQANGRLVMLDFYADWCISCKEMEKFTFTDANVQAALSNAILLQADVTANDQADQELLTRFGIIGPPAILFFGRDGRERPAYRVVGFMPAERFRNRLVQVSLASTGV